MAESRDRQLKIVAVVDEASFNQARNILTQFTKELETAMASASRFQSNLGAMGGAMGVQMGAPQGVLQTGGPTPQSVVTAATSAGRPPLPGMTPPIGTAGIAARTFAAQVFNRPQDGASLAGVVQGAGGAGGVGAFNAAITGLVTTITQATAAIAAAVSGNLGGGWRGSGVAGTGPAAAAAGGGGGIAGLPPGIALTNPPPAAPPPQTLFQQLNSKQGVGPQLPGWLKGMVAVGSVVGLSNAYLDTPMQFAREQANASNMVKNRITSLRGGDLRMMNTLEVLKSQPSLLEDVSNAAGTDALTVRYLKSLVGNPFTALQRLESVPNEQKMAVLKIIDEVGASTQAMFSGRDSSGRAIGMSNLLLEEFQQQAASRVGMMRGLRMGARRSPGGGRKGVGGMDVVARRLAKGFTDGGVGMFGQLSGMLGDSLASGFTDYSLNLEAGGFSGAGQAMMGAAWGMPGGSRKQQTEAIKEVLREFQNLGSERGGGLSPAAANMLAGIYSQGMTDLAPATGGQGFLGALGAATSGFSGAQQMRIIQQTQGGMEGMGHLLGGANPWQRRFNLLQAIRMFPGIGVMAQDRLSTIMKSPRMVLDILQGGKEGKGEIPKELQYRGIKGAGGLRDLQSYVKSIIGSTQHYGVFKGDPRESMQEGLIAGGYNPSEYLKRSLIGLKGEARTEKQEEIVGTYGTMLAEQLGMEESQGAGMARALMLGVGGKGEKGKVKGRGFGDVAASTAEMEQFKQSAKNMGELNDAVSAATPQIKKWYGAIDSNIKALSGFSDMSKGASEATVGLLNVGWAAEQASKALWNVGSHSSQDVRKMGDRMKELQGMIKKGMSAQQKTSLSPTDKAAVDWLQKGGKGPVDASGIKVSP